MDIGKKKKLNGFKENKFLNSEYKTIITLRIMHHI
jgi:hypothetical protein